MMQRNEQRRAGFTLVEILVVIAIIGILAALTATGVVVMIGVQHRRNTESTIRVLDKMLQNRWHAVVEDAKKESISPSTHANVFTLAGGDVARARVIWTKVRLVEAFPMKYTEVIPLPTPPNPPSPATIVNYYIPASQRKSYFTKYQTKLAGMTTGSPGESAACLLLALKTMGSDGVTLDDQLKHAISASDNPNPNAANPTVNKIDTLVDGWGKPLVFNRFDISLVVQAANKAQPNTRAFKFSDPEDPEGMMMNPNWYYAPPPPTKPNPMRVLFEVGDNTGTIVPKPGVVGFHTIALVPPPAATARANYVMPTIISGGKDNNMNTSDDIINLQLRGQ